MTTTPKRVQRKRTKGWRKPDNTVCVDRTSKWGNYYRVGESYIDPKTGDKIYSISAATAVLLYEQAIENGYPEANGITKAMIRAELRGKRPACFCALDAPCHADVLLRIANE